MWKLLPLAEVGREKSPHLPLPLALALTLTLGLGLGLGLLLRLQKRGEPWIRRVGHVEIPVLELGVWRSR